MGVNLREIIPPEAIRNVEPEHFAGKVVAVDAFNAIYQFLSTIRQADGTPLMDSAGLVTSHLSGVFYRNARLMEAGAKIAYVFDGKAIAEKKETIEKREAVKKEAEKNYEEALEAGDLESAKKYAQATSRLTSEMIAEAKALLNAMGIATIDAKAEGEAQAAFMARKGLVDYSASQDYDSLLFGAPELVRNLSASGKRRVPRTGKYVDVPIEIIDLKATLEGLKLTREKLIQLGILVGTDYNPGGIKGIGPKKGLALVQKEKDVFEAAAVKEKWTSGIQPKELMKLFTEPQVDEAARAEFPEFEPEKVRKILCEKHEFGRDRIDSVLKKIEEFREEQGKQKGLNEWF